MGNFLRVGLRILRGSKGRHRTRDILDNGFAVGREVVRGAPGVEAISQTFIILREERRKHRQADPVDGTPTSCIRRQGRNSPDPDTTIIALLRDQFLVGYFEHDRIDGMPCKQVFRPRRIPAGQIDLRAVLKGMADSMQHIWFDPEGISRFTGPETQSVRGACRHSRDTLGNDFAGRARIDRFGAGNAAEDEELLSSRVGLIESNAVSELLDGISVEIDFEFIHPFRMVTRAGNFPKNGVANVNYEDSTYFTSEEIKVRDVEADVLAREG